MMSDRDKFAMTDKLVVRNLQAMVDPNVSAGV
jgi:hypothetical protein